MQDYKALAFRYFSGSISKEEGDSLFRYLDGDETRFETFCQWEREWMATHDMSPATRHGWLNVSDLIPFSNKRSTAIVRRLTILSVAASVTALLCMGIVAAFLANDSNTVCQAPVGGRSAVVLPDGSRVDINARSQISYSSRFNITNRRVRLQGEALFDVAKHNGATFTVSTAAYDIVVRGTRFNISAYSDEDMVTTRLYRGKVEVRLPDTTIVMKPGQTIAYSKSRHSLTLGSFATNDLGWTAHHFVAENTRLGDIARQLSRQYGVKIHVENAEIANVGITMRLNNVDNVDDVIKALKKVVPITTYRKGKEIYIK